MRRACTRTVYPIRTLDGGLVARHVRTDWNDGTKSMYWQRDGADKGLGDLGTADLPLYGTERLVDVPTGETVLVCEGERATEACWEMGFHAVGTVTGASGTPGEDALSVLLEYDVVLWPDNDDQGRTHMARVGAALRRLGGSCRLVEWGVEKGDDARDFQMQGTCSDLGRMVTWATDYRPTVEEVARYVPPARRPEAAGFRLGPSAWPDEDAWKDAAKAAVDIVDVIGRDIPLRKMGASFKGLCPFHGERTASFDVSPIKQAFYCHGCQERGDVIRWIERREGVDYPEALRRLEALSGLARPTGLAAR